MRYAENIVMKQLFQDIKTNSNIVSSDICEAQTCNLLYHAINYEENYIHHDIKLGHLEIISSLKIELTGFGWSLVEMSSI